MLVPVIDAYDVGVNVAYNQPAFFSSDTTSGPQSLPTRAVDGLVKSIYLNGPDGYQLDGCATTSNDRDPWLAVDIGIVAYIATVVVTAAPGRFRLIQLRFVL